jgi:hypothetical protein
MQHDNVCLFNADTYHGQDLNHIGRKDAKLNENISKSSLAVAETAQRDGSLMKSIAVLGMIYLPATFVCVCSPRKAFQILLY